MKKMMKKTVGILLVATCMVGTTGFADSYYPPNENEVPQECVIMEPTSAIDMLGGIPENITGPDREDLEVLLADIDNFNESGNFEKADMLWTYVFDILSNYEVQDPDGFEPEHQDPDGFEPEHQDPDGFEPGQEQEPQDFHIEEIIAELEGQIAYFESIGDFEMAESLRAELEGLLEMGFGDPDMNHEEPEDPNFMDIGKVISEMEEEIQFLEDTGDFEPANAIREELEKILAGETGENGFEEPKSWNLEDMIESLQGDIDPIDFENIINILDEIRMLEEADDFEAANHLRGELEDFVNNLIGDGIGNHDESVMQADIVTVEDILNKTGYELSPEKVNEIERLVNEINAIVGEPI